MLEPNQLKRLILNIWQAHLSFAYENDSLKSIVDYFDADANNLRRTFLRAPVQLVVFLRAII